MKTIIRSRHGWLSWKEATPAASGGLATSTPVYEWVVRPNATIFATQEAAQAVADRLCSLRDEGTGGPLLVFMEPLDQN